MNELRIQSVIQQTPQLFHLQMHDAVPAFTEPGQYAIVQLIGDEKKAYFAFSSAPGEQAAFLLKEEGEPASTLCKAAPGQILNLISVEGSGFDRTGSEGRPVRLFSMGSGIGPFRSLLRFYLAGYWKPSLLELWHGAFTEADLPYRGEIEHWQREGIHFKGCFDQQAERLNAVQALQKQAPDLRDSLLYWVGSKGFGEALRQTALSLGLSSSDFRSNY